jgi:hypothetical protein
MVPVIPALLLAGLAGVQQQTPSRDNKQLQNRERFYLHKPCTARGST